jgi:hypothetical protein
VALVYYYFDDNPRQMLDKGRATLIVTTLMVGTRWRMGRGGDGDTRGRRMLEEPGEH